MHIMSEFYQKNGLATIHLARDIMLYNVGDRMPTISDYSEKFKVARGTIQMAIKNLIQSKSINIDKRGYQGTYLTYINYDLVWQYTGWNILSGAMPLPMVTRLEGLTTAICSLMQKNNIPFNFAFMQGSESRLRAMNNYKYDFIIVSKLTANQLLEKYQGLEIAVELPEYSYADNNVIVFSDKKYNQIEDGMKVGYDKNSADQKYLIDMLCEGKNVTKIDMPYSSTRKSVIKGDIDATIYRREVIITNKNDLKYIDLPDTINSVSDTAGVLLINSQNYGIKDLITKIIDPEQISRIQNKVISGEIEATYY